MDLIKLDGVKNSPRGGVPSAGTGTGMGVGVGAAGAAGRGDGLDAVGSLSVSASDMYM